MKKLSAVVLCFLVVAITVFLIWLHDLRASGALAELRQQVADKQLVISKLKEGAGILQEFLASDDPLKTRLAAKARQQNPEATEDQFRRWLKDNVADLRAKARNDAKLIPQAIAAREREMTDLQARMGERGGPWLFFR